MSILRTHFLKKLFMYTISAMRFTYYFSNTCTCITVNFFYNTFTCFLGTENKIPSQYYQRENSFHRVIFVMLGLFVLLALFALNIFTFSLFFNLNVYLILSSKILRNFEEIWDFRPADNY